MNRTIAILAAFGVLLLLIFKGQRVIAMVTRTALYKNNDSPYEQAIQYYANQFGVDSDLVKAIIMQESAYDPDARNPSDPSYGLMEVTHGAAQDILGYDVTDEQLMTTDLNIRVGAAYLARQVNKHGLQGGISAYNAGHPIMGNIENYVNPVMNYYAQYKGVFDANE